MADPIPPIPLRPHHVLCVIGWRGMGYSPAFTENMNALVLGRLRVDPGVAVRITRTADAICGPCPHRQGLGCAAGERIAGLDARHAAALDLHDGLTLPWAEAEARALRLDPSDLDRLCAGCQWLELGVCKEALAARQGRTASG